jgi:hypothetical protein
MSSRASAWAIGLTSGPAAVLPATKIGLGKLAHGSAELLAGHSTDPIDNNTANVGKGLVHMSRKLSHVGLGPPLLNEPDH